MKIENLIKLVEAYKKAKKNLEVALIGTNGITNTNGITKILKIREETSNCKRCFKAPPIKGKKLCQVCYNQAINALNKARKVKNGK